jgi:hypothetical protein
MKNICSWLAPVEEALPLLADRIEGLISQEHAKWLSAQQEPRKHDDKDAKP